MMCEHLSRWMVCLSRDAPGRLLSSLMGCWQQLARWVCGRWRIPATRLCCLMPHILTGALVGHLAACVIWHIVFVEVACCLAHEDVAVQVHEREICGGGVMLVWWSL